MSQTVQVEMKTNQGSIIITLDKDKAPTTVDNFLHYVNDEFYDNTLFHRVIPGFMVQGGGFDVDFKQKKTDKPIKNEADNGLKNKRGTIAMARTTDPNSATSQFFINVVNNDFLNYTASTPQGWGYAVFGEVLEGMDVVDTIAEQKTTSRDGHGDVPIDNIVIESMRVIDSPKDKIDSPKDKSDKS